VSISSASNAPSDLAGLEFVSLGREDRTRRLIDHLFESHDVARHLHVETHIAACACQFVANGMGVSMVDPVTAYYHRARVSVRRIEPTMHFDLSVVRPALSPDSAPTFRFLELLKQRVEPFVRGWDNYAARRR
jgi:DNA-binding transcriptional LysR family regulator